jgi:hypothetical protein
MGVTVTVLEEKEYEDGELVERALDYFAQHKDGSVYYFGEDVDFYEGGKLKDHHGSWLAGQGQNRPGIIMPAQPKIDQTIQTEYAPGVAEDMVTFLLIGDLVYTPAGNYSGCAMTLDFTPLEPGVEENKWYCPGIGLAMEEGDDSELKLISIATPVSATTLAAAQQPRTTTTTAPAGPAPQAAVQAATQSAAPAAPVVVAPPSAGDGGLKSRSEKATTTLTIAFLAIAGSWITLSTARRASKRRDR